MMTQRDNEIYRACREYSDDMDRRTAFSCGARWADNKPNAIDFAYLQSWYQDSIDSTKEPVWTDKHLEELFKDFDLIPKKDGSTEKTKISQIEYTRTDAFLEKACEWLNDWFTDDSCKCGIPITKTAREKFFNDFRNYIKEK